MTTNLVVIANVKQLRTDGSFRILLPFFQNILGCRRPKFSNFLNSFHNRVEFGTILEGLRNFGGGGYEPPPSRYATGPHTFQTIWSDLPILGNRKVPSSKLHTNITRPRTIWQSQFVHPSGTVHYYIRHSSSCTRSSLSQG